MSSNYQYENFVKIFENSEFLVTFLQTEEGLFRVLSIPEILEAVRSTEWAEGNVPEPHDEKFNEIDDKKFKQIWPAIKDELLQSDLNDLIDEVFMADLLKEVDLEALTKDINMEAMVEPIDLTATMAGFNQCGKIVSPRMIETIEVDEGQIPKSQLKLINFINNNVQMIFTILEVGGDPH